LRSRIVGSRILLRPSSLPLLLRMMHLLLGHRINGREPVHLRRLPLQRRRSAQFSAALHSPYARKVLAFDPQLRGKAIWFDEFADSSFEGASLAVLSR
jgi:hypothetical protein